MPDNAHFWNDQAAGFDEAPDHGLRDPQTRAAWAALLVPLMPPAPARVADLGCGTGSLAVLLAEAGYRVSGIDFSPAMVQRARAKANDIGVDVDLEVADATTPPWPAGTFDAVVARHVLWALPDPGLALDRWLELLKPGGRLVLVEGRWETGAGLSSADALALLRRQGCETEMTVLDDRVLWGRPVDDERYLLVSRRAVPRQDSAD